MFRIQTENRILHNDTVIIEQDLRENMATTNKRHKQSETNILLFSRNFNQFH